MGKGSRRRPRSVSAEEYEKNYEQAFGIKNHNEPETSNAPRERIVKVGAGIITLPVEGPNHESGQAMPEVRTPPVSDEPVHTNDSPTRDAGGEDGSAVRGGEAGA